MKAYITILGGLFGLLAAGFSPTNLVQAYNIDLEFVVDNPVMFPIGEIVPPDAQDASDIDFESLDPFFRLTVTGAGPDSVYLLVRLEREGESIFRVGSERFDVNAVLNRTLTNQDLARMDEIRLGEGGEQINGRRLLPYLNGNMLQDGLYELTVLLAVDPDWNDAIGNPVGLSSIHVVAQNASQITLIGPQMDEQIGDNPIFLWSFPRSTGIVFNMRLVSGPRNASPWSVMDAPEFEYADIELRAFEGDGGDITAHIYSGVGEERRLDPGVTYYWMVEASVPTMLEDEFVTVESPVYRFYYSPVGDGQDGGSGNQGGGGGGGNPGNGGGPDEGAIGGSSLEGGHPDPEHPVFTVLRNALPPELFASIIAQIGDLSDYSVLSIRAGNRDISLNELAVLIFSGEIEVTSLSVRK